MRNRLFAILILGFLIVGGQTYLTAQSNDEISQQSFDEYKKDIDYTKTKNKLQRIEKEKDKKEIKEPTQTRSPGFSFGGGAFLQGIAYFLIAGLILFILYFVFTGIQIKPQIDVSEVELEEVEDIEEIDAETGYTDAITNGDYRLALRMQFIKALQALSAKEIILWKPDKTNRHYINETRGNNIHPTFRSLAQTYEWVWYGNSAIGKETFDQLNPQFETFNRLDI